MEKQIAALIELANQYAEFGLSLKMRETNFFDPRKEFDSWDSLVCIFINCNNTDQIRISLGGIKYWIHSDEITLPINATEELLEDTDLKCRVLLTLLKTTMLEEVKNKVGSDIFLRVERLKKELKELEEVIQ